MPATPLLSTPPPDPTENSNTGLMLTRTSGFRDAYPDTTGVTFTEEAVDTALQSSQPHQQRWVCRVVIAENEQRPFPGPAEAASFARKKDAKQYAARCAVEWLRANRLMPGSGDEVRFHKGTVPSLSLSLSSSSSSVSPSPPKRQKVGPAEPAASGPNDDQKNDYDKDNDDTAASPPARGASTPPAHHEANPGSEEDKPSYASLVAALCHKLGFRPPSYRLEQVRTGYWSGRPELGDMEGQPFPADLGHVTNVLGKNAAKERIAEEVLKELRRVEEEREGDVREILRSLRPPVLG